MYSRSYATFENINTAKLNPELKRTSGAVNIQSIPVKSFSDDSAFERFSKLGNKPEKSNKIKSRDFEENSSSTEELLGTDIADSVEQDISVATASENMPSLTIKDENQNEKSGIKSMFTEFHKIISIIEDDWFLVILAIAMLIFSTNETKDKLTPIALLAIMFI